jgi:hypothetical protein
MEKVMAFFEIVKDGKTEIVQAENIKAISQYCKNNGYCGWIMLGMMSRSELAKNKKECRII